ncbi:2Fe-2S iron-sulfur cluster-binding protein [Pseudomonadota bacterium]
MTTLELFLYILLGIFVQSGVLAIVVIYRHMRAYQFLKTRVAGFDPDIDEELAVDANMEPVEMGKMWKGLRQFKVARKVNENPNADICSFYLEPVDRKALPGFMPGQFLTFNLDVTDPETGGPKVITRCYSLSDAPDPDYYRVSIKRAPAPRDNPDAPPGLSSNHFHDNVHEGDILDVRAPGGHFYLEPGSTPIVLIGGGIGITPVLSMLNTALSQGSTREIWLFYGLRNSGEHAMKKHLEALAADHDNFHLMVCYGDPLDTDKKGVDYQHKGYVDVTLFRAVLNFRPYSFYLCGPPPMMENLVPALEDWGVPDPAINYEAFGPASLTRRARKEDTQSQDEAVEVSVTFSKSGKTLTWDGSDDTLLDFAERNGIEVDSGCRAGGCGMCQTKIESGEVSYRQSPDHDPDAGTCLMCVARPKQDLTLEA